LAWRASWPSLAIAKQRRLSRCLAVVISHILSIISRTNDPRKKANLKHIARKVEKSSGIDDKKDEDEENQDENGDQQKPLKAT